MMPMVPRDPNAQPIPLPQGMTQQEFLERQERLCAGEGSFGVVPGPPHPAPTDDEQQPTVPDAAGEDAARQ